MILSPTLGRGGRPWILGGVVLAVLVGGAAAAWRFWPSPPPEPPMPADVREPEVRDAIQAARQNVLQKPRGADAWGLLGMTLLTHLFDRDADRCFAEAARLDPKDARWPYARGLIALKRDPDHALGYLRQAADDPSPAEDQSRYRLQLAEALLERQQLDEAEGLFQQEIRLRPDDARAAYGLGLIAVARNDPAAAEKYLTAARANPCAEKKATAQLAALARAQGDDRGASVLEKEWADLPDDPAWPDPLLDRILELQVGHRRRERKAAELDREHRFQDALGIYLQQVEEDANDARACTEAGIDFARMGQYDRALDLLREGVRRDPNSADAHYGLAVTLFTRAKNRQEETPGDGEGALAPPLADWFREAAEHAQRAAELKPDDARAYLTWGLSLQYLHKAGDAVAPLRKGVECRPERIDLQLGLGEALLESGQRKEAETYLENAHRLDPNDPRPTRDLDQLHGKKD